MLRQMVRGRAMSALTELGRVEGRQEAGEDVTAQFVDLRARVRHLEAVEAQLLRFLDRTKTIGEALAVQQRLNDVQLQLEESRGRLRYLSDQAAFATITLDVAERGVPAGAPSGARAVRAKGRTKLQYVPAPVSKVVSTCAPAA